MPTKVSEKNGLVGLVILSVGFLLLFTANLTNVPVLISEKGLAVSIVGIALLILGVRSLTNAIHKI